MARGPFLLFVVQDNDGGPSGEEGEGREKRDRIVGRKEGRKESMKSVNMVRRFLWDGGCHLSSYAVLSTSFGRVAVALAPEIFPSIGAGASPI